MSQPIQSVLERAKRPNSSPTATAPSGSALRQPIQAARVPYNRTASRPTGPHHTSSRIAAER